MEGLRLGDAKGGGGSPHSIFAGESLHEYPGDGADRPEAASGRIPRRASCGLRPVGRLADEAGAEEDWRKIMTAVPNRSTFENIYAGQPPWDIGKPQRALLGVA